MTAEARFRLVVFFASVNITERQTIERTQTRLRKEEKATLLVVKVNQQVGAKRAFSKPIRYSRVASGDICFTRRTLSFVRLFWGPSNGAKQAKCALLVS